MLANYGFFLLLLCCIASTYGCIAAAVSGYFRHRRLFLSSKMALTASCGMTIIAAGILWYSLFQRDYSFSYISKTSSNDLPTFYTFTAFWSSLEGSHFLWTLFLIICSTICIWTYSKDNEHIAPYLAAALQLILAWMFYMTISFSDPFVVQLPKPANGQGMNALLQNFYMAIHPPLLFIGYTALAVPFAYSMAALCYGDVTEGWLKAVRRWVLFAWSILTAAIALGGRWAYVELGWAGYWAWDPVENSSFLPWLLSTALLHGLLIQGQLGHLKRLNIILAILAFFMSFFGTFITRSGIITSVHAFGDGPVGPNYLIFLSVVLFISLMIYGWRAYAILPPETEKVWGISKESALIITQFLVLSFAAIVFIGTMFPIITEAITGQRISVQAPYFNVFAPLVGLGLIVAIAIGNLMRYQSSAIPHGKRIMIRSLFIALPCAALFIHYGNVLQTPKTSSLIIQIINIYLIFWSASCLTWDFYFRLKDLKFQYRLFFRRNLAYFGAYIAHIGLLVAICGFLGNFRGLERVVKLQKGQSTELHGYKFTMANDVQMTTEHNANVFKVPIQIERDGNQHGLMFPARSQYPTSAEMFHEIDVRGGFWHDLYLGLSEFDRKEGKSITLQININPTVRVVWISIVLMVIGGFIALFDRYRGNKTYDVVVSSWDAQTSTGLTK